MLSEKRIYQWRRVLSMLIPWTLQNMVKTMIIRKPLSTFIIRPHRIDGPKNIFLGSDGYMGHGTALCCYGGRVTIGDRFYATRGLNIYCGEDITIEDDVLIGSYVLITDLSHGIDPESERNYQKQDIVTKPVFIGSGCWLGDKVSILPGTHIGAKCVVGANAVVQGNIPPYSMVVGNPGKVIKKWCTESKAWL